MGKKIKKRMKGKMGKKKVVKKSANQIKEEFSKFAKNIGELETLKRELDALDTSGFKTEERLIRAKLKDVNSVPQIKKEIESLKAKIGKKHLTTHKDKKVHEKLHAESQRMKHEIVHLEAEIEKTKHRAKQLSGEEVEDVHDIPKLERELHKLRSAFEEHNKKTGIKVDSGVDVVVSTKFGDFLSAVKGELSERIKRKENMLDRGFKADLEEREKLFAERYDDLVKEFHEMYAKKVHEELGKEVKDKFNDELEKKLEEEKERLISLLVKENAVRLREEMNRLKKLEGEKRRDMIQMQKEKRRTESKLKEDSRKKINRTERELKKEEDERYNRAVASMKIKMEKEVLGRVRRQLEIKERALKAELKNKFDDKFKREMDAKKAELERRKAELEEHVVSQARRMFG